MRPITYSPSYKPCSDALPCDSHCFVWRIAGEITFTKTTLTPKPNVALTEDPLPPSSALLTPISFTDYIVSTHRYCGRWIPATSIKLIKLAADAKSDEKDEGSVGLNVAKHFGEKAYMGEVKYRSRKVMEDCIRRRRRGGAEPEREQEGR